MLNPAPVGSKTPRTILCMKWGTAYTSEDANRLYLSVARHLSGPFNFVCFTDDATGLLPDIDARPLPPINLPPGEEWSLWRKVSIWQSPLDGLSGEALFLDLDLVITRSLDDFFTYEPGKFCVIENWTQMGRGIGNTSVFRFRIGQRPDIFDDFTIDPDAVMNAYDNEQVYVSRRMKDVTFWPRDWCVSFKHSLLPSFPMNWVRPPALPPSARVVVFHGSPKPDQALQGLWPAPFVKRLFKHVEPTPWIADHWG